MHFLFRLGAIVSLLAFPLRGIAENATADHLRENEQGQEQLAEQARALIGALEVMLGEYARNGLGGEDVANARSLQASIAKLSTEEMRAVVDLLQQARSVQNPGASAKTAAEAFSAQKQIVVSIQRILAAHARQQEVEELARAIDALADRQARNLQNGIELGRLAGPAKPENLEAVMQAQLETQRGEQEAITAELKVLADRARRFASDPANADVADRFREGAEKLHRVAPRAGQAEEALRAGQLFKAVAEEKVSRDELRKISRALAIRERGPAALRQAERDVAQLIADQDVLRAETAKQRADEDFAKWIAERMADIDPNRTLAGVYRHMTPEQRLQSPELRAEFDEEQRDKATQLAKLEDTQGELAARADHLAEAAADAPKAGEHLQRAHAAMQEARSAMQEAEAPAAEGHQRGALEHLQAAQAELKQKADEAELLAGKGGDRLQDLERLRSAVEGLAQQEAAMAKAAQPDATEQADVARRAAQIAQRSRELAPSAAPALQQAAAHAENSRAAMSQKQNAAGRQQAQQAAARLAEAAQQIRQEQANAQQLAEQQRQAEAALRELAALVEAEQRVELATGQAMPSGKPAVQALAPEQRSVESRTTAFKASLSGGAIAAVQALNDAENAMTQAAEALTKGEAGEARRAESEAIAQLFNAQRAIQRGAAAARQQLGQPFASADAMARAANQTVQAMQEVAAAQQQLQQAAQQMGQEAAQTAAEAAQQAVQAAQEAARAAQAAQQQAAQAGNQRAAQSAANAAAGAEQAAEAAQQAVQSARQMMAGNPQAAIDQAQRAAQQAGQAMQSSMQANAAAQQAQSAAQSAQGAGNQAAAQQAGAAARSAQQAAAAAQRAQQLANAALNAAQNGQAAANQAMQQSANRLGQASMQAGQAAAQQAGSEGMQQALQQAAQQLSNAAAQAAAGQNQAAQQSAQQAGQQLAQAAAMGQAAQAGIGEPSAGQMPGQGSQGQMAGQGMQGAGRQPGQGQGSGPTSQANNQPSEGATGYQPGGDPESVQRAARQAALKQSGFLGLPPRDRATIQQSAGEKYPQEFAPLIEQYLLNLANEPAAKR